MPPFPPDKFEAGTHNIAGIFGLLGALKEPPGHAHTREDFRGLINGIRALKSLKFYGAADFEHQGPVFSITHNALDCAEIGRALYDRHKIEVRVGLHCAPMAHQSLGTFPEGTVRIAPSKYHRPSDFQYLLAAIEDIDSL
jgi:selenocysteine lyase/cysteine desulfurase